jgi:hypothetical protein
LIVASALTAEEILRSASTQAIVDTLAKPKDNREKAQKTQRDISHELTRINTDYFLDTDYMDLLAAKRHKRRKEILTTDFTDYADFVLLATN